METLVEERGELIVKDEDSARELLAELVSKPER